MKAEYGDDLLTLSNNTTYKSGDLGSFFPLLSRFLSFRFPVVLSTYPFTAVLRWPASLHGHQLYATFAILVTMLLSIILSSLISSLPLASNRRSSSIWRPINIDNFYALHISFQLEPMCHHDIGDHHDTREKRSKCGGERSVLHSKRSGRKMR
ncbi:hypothetical protein I308_104980 [Cryptococcus tetragattii IND107]|uniref:Uncharacterized protein n=1 Tax=Cryptococcus tetragattii IND107 TaxID=1296105 RepID=A0ABR3BP41_9TREE